MKNLIQKLRDQTEHLINFGSFLGFRVFALGLFAVTVSLFINRVGSDRYGMLSLLLVVFNFIQILDLGVGFSVNFRFTRSLARESPVRRRILILRRALPFYLGCASIGAAVFFLAAPLLGPVLFQADRTPQDPVPLLRILSGSVFLILMDSFLLGIMRAYNRIYLINLSGFFFDLARSVAMLAGVFLSADLRLILLLVVAGNLFKFLFDAVVCHRLLAQADWYRPLLHAREFALNLRFGLPMMAYTALGMLGHHLDKFFVARVLSLAELSYYSVAYDVTSKAWVFVYAVNTTLYTLFLRKKATGESHRTLIVISVVSVIVLALFYYLPVVVFALPIFTIWIGEDFARNAAPLMPLLGISSVLYLFSTIVYNHLQTSGRGVVMALGNLAGLLGLVGGLLVLPGRFGIQGVAGAYCTMYVVMILVLAPVVYFSKPDAKSVRRRKFYAG